MEKIQILRNETPVSTRAEALQLLTRTPHLPGQPVVVFYTDETTGEVNQVMAIGTGKGIGQGYYRVLSVTGLEVISGIVSQESELPDSSSLTRAETYLYQEPVTGDLSWIYLSGTGRVVERVNPGATYRIVDSRTATEYYIDQGILGKVGDYYSKDEVDARIAEALGSGTPPESGTVDDSALRDLRYVLGLGTTGEYPGGVPGATNFNKADEVLFSRVTEAQGQISSLAREQSGIRTRLDRDLEAVLGWYKEQSKVGTAQVELYRIGTGMLYPGTTHYVKAVFTWSSIPYTEVKLGEETRTLPGPTGTLDMVTPITIGTQAVQVTAGYVGSEKKEYLVLQPVSTPGTKVIATPDSTWTTGTPMLTVTFEGPGERYLYKGDKKLHGPSGDTWTGSATGELRAIVGDTVTMISTGVMVFQGSKRIILRTPGEEVETPGATFHAGDTIELTIPNGLQDTDRVLITGTTGLGLWIDITGSLQGGPGDKYTYGPVGAGTFKLKLCQ